MYYLGYDLGSSSIKIALIQKSNGKAVKVISWPDKEMPIDALQEQWCEQHPDMWWRHAVDGTRKILQEANVDGHLVEGIGISYQMHGLVVVDKDKNVLRPSIIWCDSRAVQIGEKVSEQVGEEKLRGHLLNSVGNFTFSKLLWVKEHEPATYSKIHKIMLPGDFLAMKMTGECTTTLSGLSEGMMLDFDTCQPAWWLLDAFEIDRQLLSDIVPTFGVQGRLLSEVAELLGLKSGIPILYRAGDQPNNALSLEVMAPGEIASTGGTSGVVYAISGQKESREIERINNFAHVNHRKDQTRIGKLLCINGAGILYSWLKNQFFTEDGFDHMNALASGVPIGADGLRILSFGNGAERMLCNKSHGAEILNFQFNTHHSGHMVRAALEGIAFSFVYGLGIMAEDGVQMKKIKAGNDNLYRSQIFGNTISTLTGCEIELKEVTGAVGAARAAAVAAGEFDHIYDASAGSPVVHRFTPNRDIEAYRAHYEAWKKDLENYIKKSKI